jgi:hypothetical protein
MNAQHGAHPQGRATPSVAPSVAYIIDPRFGGGTSSALAQELRVVCDIVRPRVYAVSSQMFRGDRVAPQLEQALQDTGLSLIWDPAKVEADIVILHNPSFLKFQSDLGLRILARRLYVVTHENFLRPGGALSFDVDGCLGQIDRAALALDKVLAPISPHNRAGVNDWRAASGDDGPWSMLPENWFNICDFDMRPPVETPRDRRGRLSRAGHEKFPGLDDMELCFPALAQRNLLLGGDTLLDVAPDHPHWDVVAFRAMEVAEFFDAIDFMIYFTSVGWQESFGRVLAEGIAAGKLVISDARTAANFAGGVVASTPREVNQVIAGYIRHPDRYRQQVGRAQTALQRFSPAAFAGFFADNVIATQGHSA